jgi:cation diffusion facilitator family transporter
MFSTARGAATLSLLANLTLVGLKLTVGLAIGSISVLSDAVDSGMDLIGATIALFAVRFAARPADRDHPYGHGKMENVSGIVESLLILLGAGLITFEASRRLIDDTQIGSVELGIVAMSLSLVINIGVSFHLRRVARRTGSLAIEATAWHRTSDIVTSLGVLLGLVMIQFTPWDFLDPAVAIAVAFFIAWTALRLFRRSFVDLIDIRLPDQDENLVREVLRRHAGEYVGYHTLRTRRSGRQREIDFHLVFPRIATIADAHNITDRLEAEIGDVLPDAVTTIHMEPCPIAREECDSRCTLSPTPYCHAREDAGHTKSEEPSG